MCSCCSKEARIYDKLACMRRMLFSFFFLFFLSTQRISSPSSIHPDLAFRLHGFRTLSPFPPPFVSSKVHARYPGYQLIIRPAPFSIIDRRSRSIGRPFAWVISVTRIVPSSINLTRIFTQNQFELSDLYIGGGEESLLRNWRNTVAVTQNGLRQGWPPLFTRAIFISSTCAALPSDSVLRIAYGWNFLLILVRGKNRGVSQKTIQCCRQITTNCIVVHRVWQLAKLT